MLTGLIMKRRLYTILVLFALFFAAAGVSAQTGSQVYHTVTRGQTLNSIARLYNVPVQAIVQANNIANPNLIYAGRVLIIPLSPAPPPPGSQTIYVVQPGDRLSQIAARVGSSVQALVIANNLPNANLIYPGQVLYIPREPVIYTHVVQPGQYVSQIARMYGSTTQAIIAQNGLTHPNTIYPGQVLLVPVYS